MNLHLYMFLFALGLRVLCPKDGCNVRITPFLLSPFLQDKKPRNNNAIHAFFLLFPSPAVINSPRIYSFCSFNHFDWFFLVISFFTSESQTRYCVRIFFAQVV